MFGWLKRKPEWEYGVAGPDGGRPARRHTKLGNVQFVLWKAGEQAHTVDYWHNFDPYWWPTFQRSNAAVKAAGAASCASPATEGSEP